MPAVASEEPFPGTDSRTALQRLPTAALVAAFAVAVFSAGSSIVGTFRSYSPATGGHTIALIDAAGRVVGVALDERTLHARFAWQGAAAADGTGWRGYLSSRALQPHSLETDHLSCKRI